MGELCPSPRRSPLREPPSGVQPGGFSAQIWDPEIFERDFARCPSVQAKIKTGVGR